MKKLGFLLFVPLFVLSALAGKDADDGTKANTANQELAALPAQEIDIGAIQAQRIARSEMDRIRMLQGRVSRLREARPVRQQRMPELRSLSFRRGTSSAGVHTLNGGFTLAKTLVVDSTLSLLVNGVESDTIPQGGDIVITLTFSTVDSTAAVSFWIDMDADAALDDTIDFQFEEVEQIWDNDFEDEDLALGVYQTTLYGDEGPNMVGNLHLLMLASDAGGSDTAAVFIEPMNTAQSVSGTVTPPKANVLIGAFPSGMMESSDGPEKDPWMAATDGEGAYQLFLPDTGYYDVFTMDFLGVQEGLIPDTAYQEVHVLGHEETSYNFNYLEPTSFIEGYVTAGGFPALGVMVYAGNGGGPGMGAETDANGFYHFGVSPGEYWVGIDYSVIPEYMLPNGEEVYVEEGFTETVNFVLYEADATISGTVTLGGFPLPGIEISAHSDNQVGYTQAESGGDGGYVLHVSSEAFSYNLWPENQPDSTVFTDQLWDIPPGASGVNINFTLAAGGIYGAVIVEGTTDTLDNAWISFRDTTTGFEVGTGVEWETREYQVYLPPGPYKVFAGAEGFFHYEYGPIDVGTEMMLHDIYLTPVNIAGAIEGTVTACDGGFGLGGADVWAWDHEIGYGDQTFTDSVGFYHIDLPAGNFDVNVRLEGFYEAFAPVITVTSGTVIQDFCLDPWRHVPPMITSIEDVAPDQGGWVYLTFDGGGTDEGPYIGWSIWRVPGGDFWDPRDIVFIDFIPFHGEPTYTALVHTTVDSNATTGATGDYWSHFIVSGHHPWDWYNWFDSAPNKGYSVDNIAPSVPASVQIAGVASGVQLDWAASADEDLQYFAVYRAEVSGGYGDLPYEAVEANTFTDENLTTGTDYYYAVKAVDANGNESDFSAEVNTTALAIVDGMGIPDMYALGNNYPNPFNPSTIIAYQLPEAGQVSLVVYDLTGKVIRSLVNDVRPAGYHQFTWDGRDARGAPVATGVYFYRLVAGTNFTETRKMVLMK